MPSLVLNAARSGRWRVRRGHPAAIGLVGAWHWPGGYGTDLIGRNNLAAVGTPTYDPLNGLITNSAGAGYQGSAGTGLQIQPPLTIVWSGRYLGSATANTTIFGVSYTNSDNPPYLGYALCFSGSSGLIFNFNTASTLRQADPTTIPVTGPLWMAATMSAAPSQSLYFLNGTFNAFPGATTSFAGSISYSNPFLNFGTTTFNAARNPALAHEYGLIYNRVLSPQELRWLSQRGSALFEPSSSDLAALAGFADSAATAPIAHNLTLLGCGT